MKRPEHVDKLLKKKGLSEVFITSDNQSFLTMSFAEKHALKHGLKIECFKRKKINDVKSD